MAWYIETLPFNFDMKNNFTWWEREKKWRKATVNWMLEKNMLWLCSDASRDIIAIHSLFVAAAVSFHITQNISPVILTPTWICMDIYAQTEFAWCQEQCINQMRIYILCYIRVLARYTHTHTIVIVKKTL